MCKRNMFSVRLNNGDMEKKKQLNDLVINVINYPTIKTEEAITASRYFFSSQPGAAEFALYSLLESPFLEKPLILCI